MRQRKEVTDDGDVGSTGRLEHRRRHGLAVGVLRDARDPSLVREGAWLVVGSGNVRAVAQIAQIEGDLVWVRPLPGSGQSVPPVAR
jgi:hypothetical protein